ncbi:MAG: hypothetical protein HUU46_00160 [Candidatus Hydrogenedentes bacterium]|nr:hypothetical protein [Candidatus Hydrogenedentota bacterium]
MRWTCLSVILTTALPSIAFSSVWYVDQACTSPTEDGLSWATAFTDIEPAIDTATKGDEIWVAKGVYGEVHNDPGGALVLKEGVSLYGGFYGTETSRDQRNWALHETVVDGSTSRGGLQAYHVIWAADALVVDGFTITGGFANVMENPNIWGGGFAAANPTGGTVPWTGITVAHCTFRYNEGCGGSAIYAYYVPLTIEDCVFHNNGNSDTTWMGGAVMTFGAPVAIRRSEFRDNGRNYLTGGALYIDTGAYEISRCRFVGNVGGFGGAIDIDTNPGGTISNCLFYGNLGGTWGAEGGGICIDHNSTAAVTNCTFYGNQATDGGALCTRNGSSATVTNCIAWNNVSTHEFGGTNLTLKYCDIEDMPAAGTNFSLDPEFYDAPRQDFRLRTSSPCRNAGTGIGAPSDDLNGVARPKEGAVDMGAIEMPETFFVSKSTGKPAAAGRSWATAYATIQEGVDAVAALGGGEIWVAQGVYNEPRTSARGAVMLWDDVGLLGGFAGTETTPLGRDWLTHATVIDGSTALSGAPAFNVVWAGNRTNLDGVAVTGGYASSVPYELGGGVFVQGSSVRLANCTIEYNAANTFGGGACVFVGADATFENCTFRHNTAGGEGGGCDLESGASGRFVSCRFENNSSNIGGGVNGFLPNLIRLERCRFIENQGATGGGAVCVRGGSSQSQNCEFSGNTGILGSAYYLWDINHQLEQVTCIGSPASTHPLIVIDGVRSCDIRNSIFWLDGPSAIQVIGGSAPTVTYSDVKGLSPLGDTNIDADPQFIETPDGVLLRTGSPCIDTAATLPHVPADLRGVARPQHGAYDMGAYEMRPYTLHVGTRGSGTTIPPAGDHTIFEQDAAVLQANPDPGWYWSKWEGDAASLGNGASIVVDSDKSVVAVFKQCKLTVKWPDGGESLDAGEKYAVKWKCQGDTGDAVRIELERKGSVVAALQLDTPNDGSQKCRIPSSTPAADGYRIRVTSTTNSNYTDTSNSGFRIEASR